MTNVRLLAGACFALTLGAGSASAQLTDVILGSALTAAAAACPNIPDGQTSFSAADGQAWFLAAYTGGFKGDQFSVQWLEPNGSVYASNNYTQANTGGTYCINYPMTIAGQAPASLTGTWNVKLVENNIRVTEVQFTIAPVVVPSIAITPASVSAEVDLSCPTLGASCTSTSTVTPSSVSITSTGASFSYTTSTAVYDTTGAPTTNWLVLSSNTSGSTPGTLGVSVNPSTALSGLGLVTISAAGTANNPQRLLVPITVTCTGAGCPKDPRIVDLDAVHDLPRPVLTQSTLFFPVNNSLSQELGVSDSAGVASNFIASVAYQPSVSSSAVQGWLTVPQNGPLGLIKVTASPSGLAPGGTYLATITISFNCTGLSDCSGTPASVPVVYSVIPTTAFTAGTTQAQVLAGSMGQIASGGGYDTSLTLVNLDSSSGEAELNFYADDSSQPPLPFTLPQNSSLGTTFASTLDQNLKPNALVVFDTTSSAATTTEGFAQLMTVADINGFAIFTSNGQSAVAPLETRNASSYLLAFDYTGGLRTGVAIANLASSQAAVNVVVRNDAGAQINSSPVSITLDAQSHMSFMLDTPPAGFPAIASGRGTVEFDTPSNGRISVLGLRANPSTLTSLPLLASVGTSGGTMPHIVFGNGWQTTLTLVNTGSTAATANLNFFGDGGSALPLQLNYPQTNLTSNASSVSQSIPAGGSLIIVAQKAANSSDTEGSAVLTTNGNVSGFAIFRYNTTAQEAVVPLQVANAPSYVLAYDNTGSLATGLAIANVSTQPANIGVVIRDDTGAQINTATISLNLPAHGHTSFMLNSPPAMLNGLPTNFPAITSGRGTIEFDTPYEGQIAPIGLRVAPTSVAFTVTTVPVMQP
jgi:hypothetical protein